MQNNLKSIRVESQLTAKELASRCLVSPAFICKIETTGQTPALRLAYAIAQILNKSVYDIWPDRTEIEETTISIRRVVA